MSEKTFKAIIIDDERHCIETLRYELSTHCPEVTVIESHQDTFLGIKAINELEPDIVFLDIELDNATGFQVIETLSYRDFHLIITTAYNQYAIEALRIKAYDYLMKPVSGKKLRGCLDRLIQDLTNSSHINQLSDNASQEAKKIILPIGKSTVFITVHDIVRVQADGNFSIVHMYDAKEHYISKSLKELESLLEGSQFIRIHKSHIVNINKIIAYHRSEGGSIEMSDHTKLPLTMVSITEITNKVEHLNL